MAKRKRIIVLLPSYKTVPTLGLLTLVPWAMRAGMHHDCELAVVSNLYIEDARYTLAKQAIISHNRAPLDAIVWLDDDHVWREEAFNEMVSTGIKSKYDALSAMYYSRSRPDRVVAQMVNDDEVINMSENTGIQDCEVLGFGMLVMKPEFLLKMFGIYSTELFRTEFDTVPTTASEGGTKVIHYTEDKMFFRRVKDKLVGAKIGVNTDVCIGHCGVVR